jgi:acyl-CoA synthetase (AMP-forming)/AMP-acid ligase II
MNLVHLLLRSARWLPDRPALAKGRTPVLAYGEFAARVSQLGFSLKKKFALDSHCVENIARFKRPREYRFVDSLPKNNYGKVLKTELRRRLG